MKTYQLHSVLTFGKYRNLTLEEVLEKDKKYLIWCLDNVKGFALDTQEFIVKKSFDAYGKEYISEIEVNPDVPAEEEDTYYYDHYQEETYTRYEGSYASDEMGFSDQMIDDVFDGDPDAYWNID